MSKVVVGQVGKAKGFAGQFHVAGRDFVLPTELPRVFIDNQVYAVQSIENLPTGKVLLQLKGVEPSQHALLLRKDIFVEREFLPDSLLWSDLIGCEVWSDEKIGEVQNVQNHGASDILVIQFGAQQRMFPYLAAYFDESHVVSQKRIYVKKAFFEYLDVLEK